MTTVPPDEDNLPHIEDIEQVWALLELAWDFCEEAIEKPQEEYDIQMRFKREHCIPAHRYLAEAMSLAPSSIEPTLRDTMIQNVSGWVLMVYEWLCNSVTDGCCGEQSELNLRREGLKARWQSMFSLRSETADAPSLPQTPVDDSPAPSTGPALQRCQEIAYQMSETAVQKNPDLANGKDKDVYDWIQGHMEEVDYEPPSFETWCRYVRAGRNYHGTRKHTPRAGRPHGRSIVHPNQIDPPSPPEAD